MEPKHQKPMVAEPKLFIKAHLAVDIGRWKPGEVPKKAKLLEAESHVADLESMQLTGGDPSSF